MNADPNASARTFWNRVEALFNDALDLDPPARAQWLDEQCGDDRALRAEVQSLLDAYARATAFLPQAMTSAASPDSLPAGLHEGDVAGAFRLVRRLAAGGMGTVYLAERVEGGFAQSVAVKVIAAPVVHEDAARRFRTERQILASLSHPYIVSLLDGGVTPRGEAYLVMELVEGEPITTYCRERGLDLRARLRALPAGVRCRPLRARALRRPSRPQARERARDDRRRAEGARLRRRQARRGPMVGRQGPDRSRARAADARLREPRAAARSADYDGLGRVCPRCRPLRAAGRRAPVRDRRQAARRGDEDRGRRETRSGRATRARRRGTGPRTTGAAR